METTEWRNQTVVTEFILLGFGDSRKLHIISFLLFLAIYVFTTTENIFIIGLIASNNHLHTPMYFFLGNLSCMEIFYISNILPKLIAIFLTGDRSISVWGCIVQFYFFASLASTESALLSVMSYDRYLAICKPLHYVTIMNSKVCLHMAAWCWLSGFAAILVVPHLMSRVIFCGPNIIDHFFCDLTPIMKMSCGDIHELKLMTFILAFMFILPPFLLTLVSYIFILRTILKIPSSTGRQKAFSTCSSHLIVVTIFFGSLCIVYVLPRTETLRELNKVFSVFYTIITPLVNPLIYSLRNREVKEAFRKIFRKIHV
ncbi:olfactory receptor 6B1-like [Hemicordylus capensis]|uniref:olfactory receptor 6B1-like n=1 Tax=Hemicordylus capensis TaxID=884348 RepID=UPI002302B779|nr:olfactory receptor 6B1-like [Hemicordylus capensis]